MGTDALTPAFPRSIYGLREVGNKMVEGQWMVAKAEEAVQIVARSNGKCSVFTSHNSYPGHGDDKIVDVKRVRIHKMFFDLDHKEKPENAFVDLVKLYQLAEEERWPWEASYSGAKGFHFFIKLDPAIYPIDLKVQDDETIDLRAYYMAVAAWLTRKLGLRTIDTMVAQPKAVHRIWNTKHFNKKTGKSNGRYCIPLTPRMIEDWTFEEIVDSSYKPNEGFAAIKQEWNEDKDWFTFAEFLAEYHIHPYMRSDDESNFELLMLSDYLQPENAKDKANWEWFKRQMPDPCVHNSMYNMKNPPHVARFASAVAWRGAGVDMLWVDQFYQQKKYADVHRHAQRRANLRSIWNRGPGSTRPHLPLYRYPSCKKLYLGGICIGPACPKFNRYLQEVNHEVQRDDKGKWLEDLKIVA